MEIIRRSDNTVPVELKGYWRHSGDISDSDAYCDETIEKIESNSKTKNCSQTTPEFFYQPKHTDSMKLLRKTNRAAFYDKKSKSTSMDATDANNKSLDMSETFEDKKESEDDTFVVSDLSDNDKVYDQNDNYLQIESDMYKADTGLFLMPPGQLFVIPSVIPSSPHCPHKMSSKLNACTGDVDGDVYRVKMVDINLDEDMDMIEDRGNVCSTEENEVSRRVEMNQIAYNNEVKSNVLEDLTNTQEEIKTLSTYSSDENRDNCANMSNDNIEENRSNLKKQINEITGLVSKTKISVHGELDQHKIINRGQIDEKLERNIEKETTEAFVSLNVAPGNKSQYLDSLQTNKSDVAERESIETKPHLDKFIDVGSLKKDNKEKERSFITTSCIETTLDNNNLKQNCDNKVVSTAHKHNNTRHTLSTNQKKETDVCFENKPDYRGLFKVTVTQQYIEPKRNILSTQGFLSVPATGYSDLKDDSSDQEKTETEEPQPTSFRSFSRRRSLSEGDLFYTAGKNYLDGQIEIEEVSCEKYNSSIRRHSRSCSDLLPTYNEEDTLSTDSEESSCDDEDQEYESDPSDEEDIVPYQSQNSSGKQEEKKKDSPVIEKPRRKVSKKRSFIAKSISVDLLPQHNRYFSNIRNRRNGLINPIEAKIQEEEHNDFIADLIEFKKVYKKPKKGLRIARSVESFFDKSAGSNPLSAKTDSNASIAGKTKKKRFLSSLFTRNEKMEYLRETSILDDDEEDTEVSEINNMDRPKISVVEDSIKKVAGVIELYIDENGDVIRKIEITKVPGQSLGFFIRFGNGIDRNDGIFISRVTLGSFVDENNLMHSGDEILSVNKDQEKLIQKIVSKHSPDRSLMRKTLTHGLPNRAKDCAQRYNIPVTDFMDSYDVTSSICPTLFDNNVMIGPYRVDVTDHTLEKVAFIMQSTQRLIIKTRSALPLPLNTSPLLRNYSDKHHELMITSLTEQLKSDGEEPSRTRSKQRTKSDPYRDGQLSVTSPSQRDRSWSMVNGTRELKLVRGLKYQQGQQNQPPRAKLSPIQDTKRNSWTEDTYYRARLSPTSQNGRRGSGDDPYFRARLSPTPDSGRKSSSEDDSCNHTNLSPRLDTRRHSSNEDLSQNKSFSRAQRYQSQKSPTRNTEKRSPTNDSLTVPSFKKPLQNLKSPKLFRREHKKQPSGGSVPPTASNDSLSSTSDSEDSNGINHLEVYPSDSMTIASPLKSFTGKLVVSIYKLIGRLSAIDGECYCTIEIDGEFKATTQLRRIKELVTVDEKFEIDLQKTSILMFHIFHKQGKKQQHKLVTQSCIHLEKLLSNDCTKKTLLLGTTNRVQMQIKLNFTGAESYLQRSPSLRQNGVFGFNLSKTLAKEENTIPIIVRKCVEEIEKRGLELTGIYRICGNARKKKQLRKQFEENSHLVNVSNENEVDCHVLAGILKDYLRELPHPLISNEMYQNIYNELHVKQKDQNNLLGNLMKKLPYANRATLIYIMDHLKRVAAFSETNKMTNQNLAVCFGPVMMFSSYNSGDMLDFKKQIDALEFLLSIWPVNVEHQKGI